LRPRDFPGVGGRDDPQGLAGWAAACAFVAHHSEGSPSFPDAAAAFFNLGTPSQHLSNTLRSAKLTLGRAAIFAADSGHRVISVDYTQAPEAKFC
jgi:hypothetical protein